MLQTNLIFGIQEQIKAGARAKKAHKAMLEESSEIIEETPATECILESSFIADMYTQAEKAKKKGASKKSLVMESFEMRKAHKKLEKDIVYFNYLFENFVDEAFEEQYKVLLESIFDDTIKLYSECDVTPRLASQALDSTELNESQIVDIYKNRLNTTIKNEYTKPMLSGKITELYESQIKDITRKLIQEGSDLDANAVKVYMPFEETLYQFNKSILVPDIAISRIESFMESVTEEYLEFIEESAVDILQQLEKKIKLLTAMISPNVFNKAVDAEGIDAPKLAGITIATDSNFVEPEASEVCPMDAQEDPEAAEEMRDEEEALDLEDASGDVIEAEDQARESMDLATTSEDYEDTPAREEEAEESAAEETAETGEQPGAIEVDTNTEVAGSEDANGNFTNGSDKALQGQGNDNGEDSADGATLPGGGDAQGEDLEQEPAVDTTKDTEVDEPSIDSSEEVSDEAELKTDEEITAEDEEDAGEPAEGSEEDAEEDAEEAVKETLDEEDVK